MALRLESRLRKVEQLARKVRDPARPESAVITEDSRLVKLYYHGGRVRLFPERAQARLPKGFRGKVYIGIDLNDLI